MLVVENDDRVARALARALRAHGYSLERATGVQMAREALAAGTINLALVDLGLDDGDGVDVIRLARARPEMGIIAVTARGAEEDRVRGLRAGADDYLVKPFSTAELMARIEAVTRRLRVATQAAPAAVDELHHGALRIDPNRYEVFADDELVPLSRKEFEVLALLVRKVDSVVAREHILDTVWQSVWEGASRTLDTHMTSLRSKLAGHLQISTVRGVGYRLEPPGGTDHAAEEVE